MSWSSIGRHFATTPWGVTMKNFKHSASTPEFLDFTITSPGNSRKIITVGSVTDNGTGTDFSDDYVSTYSSRGPTLFDHVLKPDLVAPGNRVVASIPATGKLRGDLPDQLLVDALDDDVSLAWGFRGNAFRQLIVDRMGKAQRQGQSLTLRLRLVTNTDQLQLALEALSDTQDHVVDQGTSGAGHRHVRTARTSGETQLTIFLDDFNSRMQVQCECALGALH